MNLLRDNPDMSIDVENNCSEDFFLDNTYGQNNASKVFGLMLLSNHPLSFLSGSHADYSKTLSKASSGTMHHIYPKSPMLLEGYPEYKINALANLCIINDQDNNRIKDKMPHQYTKLMHNEKRHAILKSALCPDGILSKEYSFDVFIEERSKMLNEYVKQLMTGEI